MMNPQSSIYGIQSTAGAVPVRNEKGALSMQKVKVHRYVSGKRPDYAQHQRSDSESDEEDFLEKRNQIGAHGHRPPAAAAQQYSPEPQPNVEDDLNDPRLRRLKIREIDTEIRPERRRHIAAPEVLESSSSDDDVDVVCLPEPKHTLEAPDDDESEAELSDTEIERKREQLRTRMIVKKEEQDLVAKEDDKSDKDSSESSEYEEYTDSEEETGPRLKPVFVRKRDRITVMEREKEAQKQRQMEAEAVKHVEERRRDTLKMVEEVIKKEQQVHANKEDNEPNLNDVCTDDENDEVEYEAWKLRELKRIKRDREERENLEKERTEIERMRNLTDEERRLEARLNPKQITNKALKGKYKFLQKYYHRGAFYLDNDDDVYKRDFSQATLEDHFDKTILPKVMQVKNFGRSGRTKYTHLVDQDTTQFDSPWSSETAQNVKFHALQGGGAKQVFARPSVKKRKMQE